LGESIEEIIMTYNGFDGIKIKIVEKIITDSYESYSNVDNDERLGYMEGVLDSLYSIVSIDFNEDKKILNE
jgi:hypothetical protein